MHPTPNPRNHLFAALKLGQQRPPVPNSGQRSIVKSAVPPANCSMPGARASRCSGSHLTDGPHSACRNPNIDESGHTVVGSRFGVSPFACNADVRPGLFCTEQTRGPRWATEQNPTTGVPIRRDREPKTPFRQRHPSGLGSAVQRNLRGPLWFSSFLRDKMRLLRHYLLVSAIIVACDAKRPPWTW